eukprot:2050278-Alexandrium_andersonii.AAC.1
MESRIAKQAGSPRRGPGSGMTSRTPDSTEAWYGAAWVSLAGIAKWRPGIRHAGPRRSNLGALVCQARH